MVAEERKKKKPDYEMKTPGSSNISIRKYPRRFDFGPNSTFSHKTGRKERTGGEGRGGEVYLTSHPDKLRRSIEERRRLYPIEENNSEKVGLDQNFRFPVKTNKVNVIEARCRKGNLSFPLSSLLCIYSSLPSLPSIREEKRREEKSGEELS